MEGLEELEDWRNGAIRRWKEWRIWKMDGIERLEDGRTGGIRRWEEWSD
jgi:hypothetical protein